MTEKEYPTVTPDDFARRFSVRSGNLMWLLGAGASAAAGIPTAWDMIWEFKQQLYVSQKRGALKTVADLSNPAVRRMLHDFIASHGDFPAPDSPEEYAALFEAVCPSEADRRTYIDAKKNQRRQTILRTYGTRDPDEIWSYKTNVVDQF